MILMAVAAKGKKNKCWHFFLNYLLEGGINHWITVFGETDPEILPISVTTDETLKFQFPSALGDRYECSDPSPIENEHIEFEPKIQLQIKRDKSGGGCG